jgi:hypothetical protein
VQDLADAKQAQASTPQATNAKEKILVFPDSELDVSVVYDAEGYNKVRALCLFDWRAIAPSGLTGSLAQTRATLAKRAIARGSNMRSGQKPEHSSQEQLAKTHQHAGNTSTQHRGRQQLLGGGMEAAAAAAAVAVGSKHHSSGGSGDAGALPEPQTTVTCDQQLPLYVSHQWLLALNRRS